MNNAAVQLMSGVASNATGRLMFTASACTRMLCYYTPIFARGFAKQEAAASAGSPVPVPLFPFARQRADESPAEYAKLRMGCPVAKAKLDDGTHVLLVSHYNDVCQVLEDERFQKARASLGYPIQHLGGKAAMTAKGAATFVDMNPPEHTHYRGMVEHWFTKEKAEEMRPGIQKKVDGLIDQMQHGKHPMDMAQQFSNKLPFMVMCEMLGVPVADVDHVSKLMETLRRVEATAKDTNHAHEELLTYLDQLVHKKEKTPCDDLISDVIENQVVPGHMTFDQLVCTVHALLVASTTAIANAINLGVITMLQHPDQLSDLKSDPTLVANTVEEILRYHTTSGCAARQVVEGGASIGKQAVKNGDTIIPLNQSANRDAKTFPDPDDFDIMRPNNSMHLSFGYGPHACLGQWLARVELQCAIGTLFTRLPDLRLAVPASELQYTDPKSDVGVTALPVTW